jgi:hypothetical protein
VNDCLVYQRNRAWTHEHLDWLRSLPTQVQGEIGEVRVVHGGWADPIDEYLKPSAEYFERVDWAVVRVRPHPCAILVQRFAQQGVLQPRLGGTAERR